MSAAAFSLTIYTAIKNAATDIAAQEAIEPYMGIQADLAAQDPATGDTALIIAAKRGFTATIAALLEDSPAPRSALDDSPLPINIQNAAGNTAVHEAILADHLDIATQIIGAGAELNIKNASGKTAYDLAKDKTPDFYRFVRKAAHILTDNAYLLLGHGRESAINMKHRWVVPEGVMIVYEQDCGEILRSSTGYKKLYEFIKGNRQLLSPFKFRRELAALFGLDRGIKIYGPGMLAPAIEIEFMNSYNIYEPNNNSMNIYKNRYYLLKSGVYKFPINYDAIDMGRWEKDEADEAADVAWSGMRGNLYVRANEEDSTKKLMAKIKAAFRGALYPRLKTIKRELEGTSHEDLIDALKLGNKTFLTMYYDLEDLVGRFGSGIYYLTSCRSLKCAVSNEALNTIWHGSQNQQITAESALGAINNLNITPQKTAMSGKKRRHENTNISVANNVTRKKQRPNMLAIRKLQHTLGKSARRSGLKGKSLKRFVKSLKLKWGTPGRK